MGTKKYRDQFGNMKTLNTEVMTVTISKDAHTYYIDGLVPKMHYQFNITAKFMDGLWSKERNLNIETSIDG